MTKADLQTLSERYGMAVAAEGNSLWRITQKGIKMSRYIKITGSDRVLDTQSGYFLTGRKYVTLPGGATVIQRIYVDADRSEYIISEPVTGSEAYAEPKGTWLL